ncbi:hypothetical protein ACQCLI_12800 [Pseudomonas nitroreducens]|uniref:hypothetical protein n=1 Tax=Pseudomonas nitroreducens TaxID=46680 RepID=UPI003CFF55AB
MKKLSAGSGEPRYTLYVPLVMHRLSRPIDLSLLASELGNKLTLDVTASSGSGWEQLRIGPFETEKLAHDGFNRVIRYLITLCIECRYPIFFDFEVTKPNPPIQPLFIFPDDPIDAFVNLASAVIIPEHLQIYDHGVMLGHADPQMTSSQLIAALSRTSDSPTPLNPKLRLAVQAYISACATTSPMMKLVGFVICLEALCEQESRPADEISSLDKICADIEKNKPAHADETYEKMLLIAKNSIGYNHKISINTQFQNLILKHRNSIEASLDHKPTNLAKEAKLIYSMRSSIVHDGDLGKNGEHFYSALHFANISAKAILLDKLNEQFKIEK